MSKELTVVNDNVPATVQPNTSGTGLVGIREKDQLIPRLQIAAGTTCIEGDDKYIEGIKQGDIFNTLTSKIYGKEIQVVPLWYSRNRILFDQAKRQECKSFDGDFGGHLSPEGCAKCEFSQWGTGKKGKGFACTEFLNFAVAIVDGRQLNLASISFKNTGTPVARKWISLIENRQDVNAIPDGDEFAMAPQLPVYRGLYKYGRASVTGTEGVYFKPTINNAGEVPEQWVARLKTWHEQFSDAQLKISSADVEDETTGGN